MCIINTNNNINNINMIRNIMNINANAYAGIITHINIIINTDVNFNATKNIDIIQGVIVITERNTPVREIYKNHGFIECGENVWAKDITEKTALETPRWIKVNIVQNA